MWDPQESERLRNRGGKGGGSGLLGPTGFLPISNGPWGFALGLVHAGASVSLVLQRRTDIPGFCRLLQFRLPLGRGLLLVALCVVAPCTRVLAGPAPSAS